MEMKVCSKCKTEYPKTYEYFGKSGKYMQSWCRKCIKVLNDSRKEYKRQYHLEHRESHKEAMTRRYRTLHPLIPKEELPEGMKRCSVCKEVRLAAENFGPSKRSKDGFRFQCNQCRKNYYRNNAEAIISKRHKYYADNKAKVLDICKEYREKNAERVSKAQRKYYEINSLRIKAGVKEYNRERARRDVNFRLIKNYRTRIYKALKGIDKSRRTRELVGCSIDALKTYLEQKFKDGMTWDNYGEWHVDHIKPCASFDFTNEDEQLECFHFTNLQPLWAEDNMKKHDKYGAP